MHKRFGDLKEFYRLKPEVTQSQREILSTFYDLRREAKEDGRIPRTEINAHAVNLEYEPDILLRIIQRLDDHYLNLLFEQRKKAFKHG